jgi:Domain of unknown function (DUF3806)
MKLLTIILMGLFSFLFGCKDKSNKTKTETFQIDGDTVTTKSSDGNKKLADYELANLNPDVQQHIKEKLVEAETLIIRYNGQLPSTKYDAKILDEVFEKWRKNTDKNKEKPEFVVEALGAALGQDIVNSLDFEWQVLTDQYGSDLTVVHKKYKVNGFPFSTAEKAFTEKKVGNFQGVKLTLKQQIQEAETSEQVEERK